MKLKCGSEEVGFYAFNIVFKTPMNDFLNILKIDRS